jgi:hypothetical protein
MAKPILSQEYLNEIFEYKDGELFYKKKYARNIKIGKKAGSNHDNGYKRIAIHNKKYYLHRIVFLMFNGYLPKEVDHKKQEPIANNKIENLRPASRNTNSQNRRIGKNNTSGIKNVFWDKGKGVGKWRVGIKVNGKTKYFGSFDDIELAELVAIEARNKYHGEYARHN